MVQWDIHMRYGRHICSGASAIDVKGIYSSVSGCTVDCSELI